jgi:hypothetical protein
MPLHHSHHELSQILSIPGPTIHPVDSSLVIEGFVTVDIGGGIIAGKQVRNLSVRAVAATFFNERQMILQKLVDDIKRLLVLVFLSLWTCCIPTVLPTMLPLQIYLPVGAKHRCD